MAETALSPDGTVFEVKPGLLSQARTARNRRVSVLSGTVLSPVVTDTKLSLPGPQGPWWEAHALRSCPPLVSLEGSPAGTSTWRPGNGDPTVE